ncbi:N-acetylmuramoyl-L-alanine amidase [Streptomyces sp. PLK6-54]|uniref:N-acetylmuramoyl-L-alanine amidase n=1 Tax=Actinacidiphila acidipaludis TaxID=2873382 RepID=A0ABS7PZA9_9ACTN|nr:N-acetylmuramoyl-L-alanine amidase [Streptomyces acidipaludis]
MATVATYGTIALASPSSGSGSSATTDTHALQDAFASAAQEFKVPQNVLMAVGYRQTRWESHDGKPSFTGNYNVMGLTQVTASDLDPAAAGTSDTEVDQSGDPAKTKGFDPQKAKAAEAAAVDTADPRLHTLDAAAKLTGTSADDLKTDSGQSVRGAAALLASYEKAAYGSLPADPARWYAAVERFSQSPDTAGAKLFADRVFSTMRDGVSTMTSDGQQVTLSASPGLQADKPAKAPLAAATTTNTAKAAGTNAGTTPTPDCPTGLACNFVPAAYAATSTTDPSKYGNYDIADRPSTTLPHNGSPDIRYIVIHDTDSDFDSAVSTFQNPANDVGTNYIVRASDGQVTQMVENKNITWHAGNMGFNQHAIGVEHEGYAMKQGSWYTEAEYDSSATLVKHLAAEFHIPLDREHIIGHDEVPGPLDVYVPGMHWDPGPYWDWNHYMSLLGAPTGAGSAGGPLKVGQEITITPPFTTANQPTVAYTHDGTTESYQQPANFVWLRQTPSSTGALISDPYLGAGTTQGPDWGDKAVAGARYVVAGVQGDWTAIWYGGQKAWFDNPGGQWTAPVGTGTQTVLTPRAGATSIPVYGRSYPDTAAYAGTQVTVQTDTDKPLSKYSVNAGEVYVQAGPAVKGDFYFAKNINGDAPDDRTLVTSATKVFYPIRYNHRLGFVLASDVQQISSTAPDPGTTRTNMLGRDASGVLWQYQGTGSATSPYFTRFKVGAGWQVYNTLVPMTELKANGTGDMVARDTSGVLWYYQGSGNPSAPFKARLKVGAGWGAYNTMSGVRDVTGDGRPDLVARDSSGVLWLYQGTGTPATPFKARVKVGAGWGAYDTLVALGDFTGDGKGDMLGRTSTGDLYLYSGTGSATAPFAARLKIGVKWGVYDTLVGPGDMSGDGKPDLIGRDSTGALWFYQGTGNPASPYAARVKVGTGWQIYGLLV